MESMIDSIGPSIAVSYFDELAIQLRTNLLQVGVEANLSVECCGHSSMKKVLRSCSTGLSSNLN